MTMRSMVVLIMILNVSLHAAEFYVSPDGNDANAGTQERPFQTVVRARDAMRRSRPTGDKAAVIILRGGTYRLAKTFELDERDSHTMYRGATGEDVRIGGNRIHGNFIHNLGKSTHHQNWGIYLDDMASGIEVSKNVVIDTDAGFLIGGGRSNILTDNVIANCPKVTTQVAPPWRYH